MHKERNFVALREEKCDIQHCGNIKLIPFDFKCLSGKILIIIILFITLLHTP